MLKCYKTQSVYVACEMRALQAGPASQADDLMYLQKTPHSEGPTLDPGSAVLS